jgi:hypothetical protein
LNFRCPFKATNPTMPSLIELNGVRVFECSAEGSELRGAQDAIDLMSEASISRPTFILIPITRLNDGFFNLKTHVAGEIIQKFVTYGMRTAIIGDISQKVVESASLRAFVAECNRGDHVWFLPGRDELYKRLTDNPL